MPVWTGLALCRTPNSSPGGRPIGNASRKPAQFLGIAAAVGAVVMIAKPWRLISLTGVIVALVKSSQLSNVVMSAMSAADFHRDRPPMDRTRRR